MVGMRGEHDEKGENIQRKEQAGKWPASVLLSTTVF